MPSRFTVKFLKYGAPMMILMFASSYGIAEFSDVRIKKRDQLSRRLTAEEAAEFKKKKKTESIEEIYETMQHETKDEWENVRGPRIWEPETMEHLPTQTNKAVKKT